MIRRLLSTNKSAIPEKTLKVSASATILTTFRYTSFPIYWSGLAALSITVGHPRAATSLLSDPALTGAGGNDMVIGAPSEFDSRMAAISSLLFTVRTRNNPALIG
jgi:hypothetical protein